MHLHPQVAALHNQYINMISNIQFFNKMVQDRMQLEPNFKSNLITSLLFTNNVQAIDDLTIGPNINVNNIPDNVSLITIMGMGMKHLSVPGMVVDYSDIIRELDAAEKKHSQYTVLYFPEAPGGTVVGLQEVVDRVWDLSQSDNGMTVISYTDGIQASAWYHVGSQANYMYASLSSIVGSIGSRVTYIDATGMYEKMGIKIKNFASGEDKLVGDDAYTLTDAQQTKIQEEINADGESFRKDILRSRKIDRQYLQGWAYQGAVKEQNNIIDGIVPTIEDLILSLNVN